MENNIVPYKRKRSNSENDIYYHKIIERSKQDSYFEKQEREKQIDICKKENEIYHYFTHEIPLRYRIIYSHLPIYTKSILLHKIDMFEAMQKEDAEYIKLSKWIQDLTRIPFDHYTTIPISINDTKTKIQSFLSNTYQILDKTIYGQQKAKYKIIEIMAQWISNPESISQVIALEGPPGVGKTSLIKHGVAKALCKPFCFYALGGARDISHLEGHSYTYEGGTYGRITEMLMESKTMNPILFLDELDKISHSKKGDEISSLLIHITDYTQNNMYQDKYFSGIDLDLSKILFFFSFNNQVHIHPVLKDRLTIVPFTGYTIEEKVKIIQEYIFPELLKNSGFLKTDIILPGNTIQYIIHHYTNQEEGIRNIKKQIENILLKINLLRLIQSNASSVFPINYTIPNIKFPLEITIEIVVHLFETDNNTK